MATAKTSGFRWLPSYYEACRDLPDAERLALYDAIVDYGFGNDPGELPPLLSAILMLITPTLEQSVRFEEKQRANAAKGGRPRKASADVPEKTQLETHGNPEGNAAKTQNETCKNPEENTAKTQNETWENPEGNPAKTQTKPRETQNASGENLDIDVDIDVDVDNDVVVVVEKEGARGDRCAATAPSKADKPPAPARFLPPKMEEVVEYCRERGNGLDARHFLDYYAANGWKVGKNPMRDWKAAVRNWERREVNGRRTDRPVRADQAQAPPIPGITRL